MATTQTIQIPPIIFQTWQNKRLPPLMYYAMKQIQQNNPRFKHYLFDDADCRIFIKTHFSADVLNAYDRLIPGAYKADLWRYCVLYKYGGIYLDVKYIPVNNFKLINLLYKEHWVLDNDKNGIYNALIVAKPNNQILLNAIEQIVINVKTRNYGNGFLDPTGPGLLANMFTSDEKQQFDLQHIQYGTNDYNKFILFNNKYKIFQCYRGYFKERTQSSIKKHYAELWNERRIYL